ncbi:LOW QUALITY PROTEIN: hypothetical protein CRUP_025311 [Coryphaenoides rupestris]|nr:LOW QUALITY PROTEIN: hypothetical protein CRUP_025311 [Coryphaenoides rupestris]
MRGLQTLTLSYLLTVLLLATLVSQSWAAPKSSFQRRNWTPQAMLYLKGTQSRSETPEKQSVNEAANMLLNFLQQVKNEANENAEQLYFQDLPMGRGGPPAAGGSASQDEGRPDVHPVPLHLLLFIVGLVTLPIFIFVLWCGVEWIEAEGEGGTEYDRG